jgi:hypothetical protein
MRFCSRCGFSMEGVMHLLAHGGMLPMYQSPTGEKTRSPKFKGVMQGAMMMLLGALIVPIFGVMSAFAPGRLENVFAFFAAMSAIIFFVGGPLRMLFAAIFEEGAPKRYQFPGQTTFAPPPIPAARVSALPPASVNNTAPWRRPQTEEILAPPSVTDSTTKLLDKEPKPE